MAEQFYRRALNAEKPLPVAHRGLGMLYEKVGRGTDAIAEYEKYIELSPSAIDRERIQRRIEALKEKVK
jgi:regulator of sirC expression with transglutaminase-like and TPR domain